MLHQAGYCSHLITEKYKTLFLTTDVINKWNPENVLFMFSDDYNPANNDTVAVFEYLLSHDRDLSPYFINIGMLRQYQEDSNIEIFLLARRNEIMNAEKVFMMRMLN